VAHCLEFEVVFAPPLQGVSWKLEPGLHVALGAPRDGTHALVELAAGVVSPASGRVRVMGADPRRSPSARRRLAALLPSEELPRVPTVSEVLELWLGSTNAAQGALEAAGLSRWSARRPAQLNAEEARSIALAAALAPGRDVAVLYEPLAFTSGLDRRRVIEGVRALAGRGAGVLVATASYRDAHELGGNLWAMESGRVRATGGSAWVDALVPGSARLRVQSPRARSLASALTQAAPSEDSILGIHWSAERGDDLEIEAADLAAAARAVARAARDGGLPVTALGPAAPDPEALRAANAGALRATFERAFAAHSFSAPAPSAAPGAATAPEAAPNTGYSNTSSGDRPPVSPVVQGSWPPTRTEPPEEPR
jgi:ABC-type multidrug transport system ATPase subunit